MSFLKQNTETVKFELQSISLETPNSLLKVFNTSDAFTYSQTQSWGKSECHDSSDVAANSELLEKYSM